jgi:hypothetical protein
MYVAARAPDVVYLVAEQTGDDAQAQAQLRLRLRVRVPAHASRLLFHAERDKFSVVSVLHRILPDLIIF